MKRRRGNKKGRPKKQRSIDTNEVASNVLSVNNEEHSAMDEHDNDGVESSMDAKVETSMTAPSPSGSSQPDTVANVDPVPRSFDKPFGKAVYKRVRVKIKNSKNIENQHTSSNSPAQSVINKSSPQVGLETHGGLINEKMEDSANSLSEASKGSSGNINKKSIGIKIKSTRGFGSCMSPCSNTEPVKGDETEMKDTESPHQESIFNEQELKAALEVIRKIMKMDAAAPFNAPVNPVALGIPDYFEVIETPMDFGTICSNLEKSIKYKTSEDVYKDVQYIWDNCLNYNNEGDHIVELAKRVRKAFTKYWTSLGLFSDQPIETQSGESNPPITSSNEGNAPANGVFLNLSGKKFHGLKKHKESCHCAICVMMRRRQEREEIARLMGRNSDDEDEKQEGIESPVGEDTWSNIENSPTDTERKVPEMKLGNFYDQQQHYYNNGDSSSIVAVSGPDGNALYYQDQETPKQNGEGSNQPDRSQRAKMLENLRYLENPMLLDLYNTLFSESFWSGPHSLGHNKVSKRKTSLHSAISSFTK